MKLGIFAEARPYRIDVSKLFLGRGGFRYIIDEIRHLCRTRPYRIDYLQG
jgi:hypothetical protein